MNSHGKSEEPVIAQAIPSYGATEVRFDDEFSPLVSASDAIGDSSNVPSSPTYRDVPFAVVFLLHLCAMIWVGLFVAPEGYEKIDFNWTAWDNEIRMNNDDMTEENLAQMEEAVEFVSSFVPVYPLRIVVCLVLPSLLIAFLIAFVTTAAVIRPHPKPVVYGSLIGSIVGAASAMMCGVASSRSLFMLAAAFASLTVMGYYVRKAWTLVPFAAVNLKVALSGIGKNWGMYLVAFVFADLGFVWNIFWVYTIVGVSIKKNNECMEMHPDATFDDDTCGPPPFALLFFLMSLYWTSTVMLNTVQVTVSGVMATWCFVSKEAESCCSAAVTSSLVRSTTYSLGSICFGSLLQAIVSVLRTALENARSQRDNQDTCATLCFCILECVARCLEDVLEYFNQWAFCFVGIYGLSYLESGKAVVELFKARGWTSIVTDRLVDYSLGFTSFVVSVFTGIVGIILENIISKSHTLEEDEQSFLFGPISRPALCAFGVSFLVGLWVSSVVMNVIKGAVNSLIVCWADSPAKLEFQHPQLTSEMADAWATAYPDSSVHFRPAYPARVV